MIPTAPISGISTPSYSSCAAFIVRRALNDSFLDASCCKVEVVNGGAGVFFLVLFLILVMINSPFSSIASTLSVSSLLSALNFSPLTSVSFAGNARLLEADNSFASMLQYSCASKLSISCSLSTISLTATDCTRPAERPRLTFFHKNGLNL